MPTKVYNPQLYNITGGFSKEDKASYLSMQEEVNQVSTSRRVQRYLALDKSDDAYIRLNGEQLEFVVASTTGTSTEQAATPMGNLVYWEKDTSGATIGTGGYPYKDGKRIDATTKVTEWPVLTYVYTERIVRSIHFSDYEGAAYTLDTFGEHKEGEGNWAFISHDPSCVKFVCKDKNNKDIGMIMRFDGFMDLFGVRRTAEIDFSTIPAPTNKLYERLDGIEMDYSWTIERDENGRISKIIDDQDGHETVVRWWS